MSLCAGAVEPREHTCQPILPFASSLPLSVIAHISWHCGANCPVPGAMTGGSHASCEMTYVASCLIWQLHATGAAKTGTSPRKEGAMDGKQIYLQWRENCTWHYPSPIVILAAISRLPFRKPSRRLVSRSLVSIVSSRRHRRCRWTGLGFWVGCWCWCCRRDCSARFLPGLRHG
jgi:hypothetical protein